jgi:nitroreductase
MITNTAITRNLELASLTRYSDFLKRTIGKIKLEEKKEWNMKQAYIALGHLLHACAQLRIDSTPMEGFDADAYDEILDLKRRNLHAAIVCAIGYRSIEDKSQFLTKVRKTKDSVIERI